MSVTKHHLGVVRPYTSYFNTQVWSWKNALEVFVSPTFILWLKNYLRLLERAVTAAEIMINRR